MNDLSFSLEGRYRLLMAVLVLMLFLLGLRLLIMQTLEYEKYHLMSEENRIRIVPEVALRGVIYDRWGKVIVENRPSYTLSAIPMEIRNLEGTAQQLSSLLSFPAEEIGQKISSQRSQRYHPVRIVRSVDFETVCQIEENADKYPGIIFQIEPTRKYPPRGIVSHVIGYTSEVSEKELEVLQSQGIGRGDDIGREGLEKFWDKYLRGRDGLTYLEITAEGKILGGMEDRQDVPPVPGHDVVIGLDYDLQQFAVSLFSDSLSGACVALDPRNGEILVFVSLPTFDANLFTEILRPEDWRGLISDPRRPLLNRVIKGEYPPGSTYKLVMAGAALEEGLITPETRFSACHGGYRFGNRVFHCWYAPGHGSLGVVDAIIQSCDIYFYQLGQKIGLAKFADYSRKCGFGAATGVDIPGEMRGFLPDAGGYVQRYGKGKWPVSTIINMTIGQGEILVTPLQLANFYAALGNGGILYKPHLLKKAFRQSDTIEIKPEIIGQLPFSPHTLAILKAGCVGVLYGDRGTARGSKIRGIEFGGKTGTAQNPHGNEHAWFVAFAPAENPIIAVVVLVEQAGHGSEAAAPIASKIIRHYLEKNGILAPPPDSAATMQMAGTEG